MSSRTQKTNGRPRRSLLRGFTWLRSALRRLAGVALARRTSEKWVLGLQPGENAVRAFEEWCGRNRGATVELAIPPSLLREFVYDASLPLHTSDEVHAYARQQFSHFFGAPAETWALAKWSSSKVRGVSALAGCDLAELEGIAKRNRVCLQHVRPSWAFLFHYALTASPSAEISAAPRGMAVFEGGIIVLAIFEGVEITSFARARIGELTEYSWRSLLEREFEVWGMAPIRWDIFTDVASELENSTAASIIRSDLSSFPLHHQAIAWPNFFGSRIKRSLMAAPLSLLGAIVLAFSAAEAWEQRALSSEAREQRIAVEQSLGRRELVGESDRRQPMPDLPLSQRSLQRLAVAKTAIEYPWAKVFTSVEQASEGTLAPVAWLSLTYSAEKQYLRLEGATSDRAAALEATARLEATPGWKDVTLRKISMEQGQKMLTFEINARLPNRTSAPPVDLPRDERTKATQVEESTPPSTPRPFRGQGILSR